MVAFYDLYIRMCSMGIVRWRLIRMSQYELAEHTF